VTIKNVKGVYIGSSNNLSITDSHFNNTPDAVKLFKGSDDNVIFDSEVYNSGSYDVNSYNTSGNNTLINLTFNQAKLNVQYLGKVYVNWWLDLYVNNSDGIPVGNANVTAIQKNGSQVFSTLTGVEHQLEDRLFLVHFNNNAVTAEGENPKINSGTNYETAQLKEGIHVNDGDNLRYNTSNNINISAGSIEFWLKPTWNGNDHKKYVFFCTKSNTNQGEITFGKFYGHAGNSTWHDYLYLSFAGITGNSFCEANTYFIEPIIESWQANTWHHLVGTWNKTNQSIKLYVDGNFVTQWNTSQQPECNWNNHPTNTGKNMSIGLYCNVDAKLQSNSTIDEFVIYDYELTPAEVLEHYRMAGYMERRDVPEYYMYYDEDLQTPQKLNWIPYNFTVIKVGYNEEHENNVDINESILLNVTLTPN
jgi:hypothetical protein